MVCAPVIAATAYFVAGILLYLYNRDWDRIPGHALLGVFAVLLVLFICQRGSELMAWTLLAFPLVLVLLSYISSWWSSKPSEPPTEPVAPSSPCGCRRPCPCCSYSPCRCRRPCWRPKPPCPKCPECPACPKPEPKPKPDNCIEPSLDK